jgi:hypothetical protein
MAQKMEAKPVKRMKLSAVTEIAPPVWMVTKPV